MLKRLWRDYDDWYEAWSERAAIMEYEAGMERLEAERLAYEDVGEPPPEPKQRRKARNRGDVHG